MDKTAQVQLSTGQQISYTFPFSHFMEAVCASVFNGREYPSMPFLEMKTIVDVGANIGCTALLFAARYPNAAIYALEPASEAFSYLRRNTSHLPNVHSFQIGAFDRDLKPMIHLGAQASVTNSISAKSMTGGTQEQITLRRFSSFVAEQSIGRISLLKVDTEGAEVPILSDIAGMFDRIDSIMLEYHSERDRLDIDRLLQSHYTLFNSDANFPHRGTNTYVSSALLQSSSRWNSLAIARPVAQ